MVSQKRSLRPKLKKRPRFEKKPQLTGKKRRTGPSTNNEVDALRRELAEALARENATSEFLKVIAGSPTKLQSVLDSVAERAARLCKATDAQINLVEGDSLRRVASYGSMPAAYPMGERRAFSGNTPMGRAVIECQTIHSEDITKDFHGDSEAEARRERTGTRTILCTPLLREGVPIGVIAIRRTEVRPFTEKQIKLLEAFASQAAIGIENVRLFQELTEALDQQTATSAILRVIANSPTEIQPVLDTIAQNAVRVCGAEDAQIRLVKGNVLRRVAHYGPFPHIVGDLLPIDRGSPPGRVVSDREIIHIEDLRVQGKTEFPDFYARAKRSGVRTFLSVPLMREGVPIGTITIRRMEVRPFSDKQIAFLKTFADEAVIAIENVRLFNELKESL